VKIILYDVVLIFSNCPKYLALKCLNSQKCCFISICCLLFFLSVNSPFLDSCNVKSFDPFSSVTSTRIRSHVTQGRFDCSIICRAAEHAVSIVHASSHPESPRRHIPQQERQCTNIITLWRFRVTFVAVDWQQCLICLLFRCAVCHCRQYKDAG